MIPATLMIVTLSTAAVILAWLYYRRYVLTHPPVGVFNLIDVAIMMGMVILVPFLYLFLPLWIVASLVALASCSLIYFTCEPILRSSWAVWLVVILLAGADVLTVLIPAIDLKWFFFFNNAIMVISVIGVANLWAQSGMKACDAAIFAAALAIYDLIATAILPVTDDLFTRLETLPFVPELAWPLNTSTEWLSIGLGDLILAAVFPLVIRKAFGRTAGIIAMSIGLGAMCLMILGLVSGLLVGTFPVMVVLGPLMVLQYFYWHHRMHQERTVREYLLAEPKN